MSVKTELRPGMRVNVYHDPFDCQELEGEAVLIRRATDVANRGFYNGFPVEVWWVQFDGMYEEPVTRTILGKHCGFTQ